MIIFCPAVDYNFCFVFSRKTISGGFSFTILKSFIPKFYYEAEVLSDVLQKGRDPNSGNCEISGPISMATMEIIGKTALDVSFNAQNAEGHPFVESLLMAMHVSFVFVFRKNLGKTRTRGKTGNCRTLKNIG